MYFLLGLGVMGSFGYFLGKYIYMKPGYLENLETMEENLRRVIIVQDKAE